MALTIQVGNVGDILPDSEPTSVFGRHESSCRHRNPCRQQPTSCLTLTKPYCTYHCRIFTTHAAPSNQRPLFGYHDDGNSALLIMPKGQQLTSPNARTRSGSPSDQSQSHGARAIASKPRLGHDRSFVSPPYYFSCAIIVVVIFINKLTLLLFLPLCHCCYHYYYYILTLLPLMLLLLYSSGARVGSREVRT